MYEQNTTRLSPVRRDPTLSLSTGGLLHLALSLRWLIHKLWHDLILQKTWHRATHLMLHLDLHPQCLQLSIQLVFLDIIRDIVTPRQALLDLVTHIHQIRHLILQPLNLINIDLSVLLLQLLVGRLHGIHLRHDILQVVLHVVRLLHVPHLALELVLLRLIRLAPLENLERLLLHGLLAGALAHPGQLLLVCAQLAVERLEFGVDGGDAGVEVVDGAAERGFGARGLGAEEAVHGCVSAGVVS
ncbi:hypothetical protein HG530_007708 [Fusarium avenaceum]|nr:hypothetical protein HG530_007708 [Fusarium avenaceum]